MTFKIITLFPSLFDSVFSQSIIKRAIEKKLIEIKLINLRDFALDSYGTVDDKPYGGGTGMLLMAEPIFKALRSLDVEPLKSKRTKDDSKILLTTPRGHQLNQAKIRDFSHLSELIIICGRYEGVDERIHKFVCDEEVSVGDYVLTGGEIPAMVIVDSITRLLEGVLAKKDATTKESFSENLLEYPQYTRPENFEGLEVPKILLSGNHKEIENWQFNEAKKVTSQKRPDLVT
ncbi:MAG: tRNA (guanosine(37)-N1)-methyltransferase TrmD [Patescibacteria group bacterium]